MMLERLKSPALHLLWDARLGGYFWAVYLGMGDWHAERILPEQHQAIEKLVAAGCLRVDYTSARSEPLIDKEPGNDGMHQRYKGEWVRGYVVRIVEPGAESDDRFQRLPLSQLGLDVGRVIISAADSVSDDTSFFGRALEDVRSTPPYEGMFDRLPAVVEHFGRRVWLVSKAHLAMQAKTCAWLEHHRFFERTGVPAEHLCFCFERPEKALICRQLGITHFIDDRLDVLEHLKGVVRHRYLFGPHDPGIRLPKDVVWLPSWGQVRPSTFRLRKPK